jgi:gas vesicle protein
MSQREGFTGGFLAGAIVGGIVGGILGTVIAARSRKDNSEDKASLAEAGSTMRLDTEEDMEMARRSLEDKIAQLNHAIDDVRQQLGTVPLNGAEDN